jgi:uncharacterized membrane protein
MSDDGTPQRGLAVFAALLALVALGVSGYLTLQTLTGQAIAGCGADDGCGAVLASPWSSVAGIPVSLLGSAAYIAVLVGLAPRLLKPASSKLGDFLLLAAAPAMLLAAGWFTYIQLVEIQEICPYCMVDHGIGVVLGLLLPVIVLGHTRLKPALPIALGVFGCLGMVAVQHLTLSEDTQSTENRFVDRDGDAVINGKRQVSLFGGELQFTLEDTPHLGDANAEQVVGLIFDYACPHCRATHLLIEEAIAADPQAFVVVPLPISIHEKDNPYISSDNARFDDSYELALLAEAVAAIDMDQWRVFDKWLFSEETVTNFPRTADEARAKAVELVGEASLSGEMTNDSLLRHRAVIDANIELMSLIPEDNRYIPVVTSPGAPRHLTERFYEIDVLKQLLDEAATGLRDAEAAAEPSASP